MKPFENSLNILGRFIHNYYGFENNFTNQNHLFNLKFFFSFSEESKLFINLQSLRISIACHLFKFTSWNKRKIIKRQEKKNKLVKKKCKCSETKADIKDALKRCQLYFWNHSRTFRSRLKRDSILKFNFIALMGTKDFSDSFYNERKGL